MNPTNVVFVVVGIAVLSFVVKLVRNRGFKGAMFGAPVQRLVGEMELRPQKRSMMTTRVKVHALEPQDPSRGPDVGIEVTRSAPLAWTMSPVSLTKGEARELAELLARAAQVAETDPRT
jgi:hypothetical protein